MNDDEARRIAASGPEGIHGPPCRTGMPDVAGDKGTGHATRATRRPDATGFPVAGPIGIAAEFDEARRVQSLAVPVGESSLIKSDDLLG